LSRFRIDNDLSPEHLDEFEVLAARKDMQIDDLWEWLDDHGYRIGRSSVHRWRRDFDAQLSSMRQSAELARAVTDLAKQGEIDGVSDAALMRLQQVLLEQTFKLDAEGEIDPLDLARLSRALKTVVNAKQDVEQLKRDHEARSRAAIEELKRATSEGDDLAAVADRMGKILGVAA